MDCRLPVKKVETHSMPIDLFNPLTAEEQQHPIFQMMLREPYGPEREVLHQWAEGFEDRDGKFVKEFQKTFESSFWELYLHAALKVWGLSIDLRNHAPDFLDRKSTRLNSSH